MPRLHWWAFTYALLDLILSANFAENKSLVKGHLVCTFKRTCLLWVRPWSLNVFSAIANAPEWEVSIVLFKQWSIHACYCKTRALLKLQSNSWFMSRAWRERRIVRKRAPCGVGCCQHWKVTPFLLQAFRSYRTIPVECPSQQNQVVFAHGFYELHVYLCKKMVFLALNVLGDAGLGQKSKP